MAGGLKTRDGDSGNSGKQGWNPAVILFVAAAVLAGYAGWLAWKDRTPPPPPPAVILSTNTAAPGANTFALSQTSGAPQVTGDNAPVLVEFTLDNTLQGTDRTLLDAALSVLPTRDVAIGNATSIDTLIQQQFAITRQTDTALFNLLAQRIRARSETLSNGTIVAAGTAHVPQITPFVAADNQLNAVIDLRASDASSTKRPRMTTGGDALVAAQKPANTSYFVQTTLAQLGTAPWQTLITRPNDAAQFRYIARPFTVDLSAGGIQPSASSAYTAPADTSWRTRLTNADRDVQLFILDTCWPDEAAWKESRQRLDALSQALRKANGLPSGPSLVASGQFPNPHAGSTHCRDIAESLRSFSGLSSRVHVTYIPMTRDQGADDVLSEILWLRFAIAFLKGNTTPAQSTIDDATKFANDNVTATLPAISSFPVGLKFAANKALLDGIFMLADITKAPYFINDSWTTSDLEIYRSAAWPEAGFVVAAVGNVKDLDVNTNKIAYAGLAVGNKSGLAVMTMDSAGNVVCNSSRVTLLAGDAGAVGYAGDTSSGCASSFAAPRVSWILAAWETMRPKSSAETYLAWRIRLRKLLEPSIPQGAQPEDRHFLFNPTRFFTQ